MSGKAWRKWSSQGHRKGSLNVRSDECFRTPATTRMSPENIMLHETSQTPKDDPSPVQHLEQTHRPRSRLEAAEDWGVGRQGGVSCLMTNSFRLEWRQGSRNWQWWGFTTLWRDLTPIHSVPGNGWNGTSYVIYVTQWFVCVVFFKWCPSADRGRTQWGWQLTCWTSSYLAGKTCISDF